MNTEKLEEIGHLIALNYHRNIKSLTRSPYATVGAEGDGIPRRQTEWVKNRRGKWNGYPPREYSNAAFKIVGDTVEIIRSNGNTEAIIPLPPARVAKKIVYGHALNPLLDGELLATRVRSRKSGGETVRRWACRMPGCRREHWVSTGIADRLDADSPWDHGATMEDIRQERVWAEERRQEERRRRLQWRSSRLADALIVECNLLPGSPRTDAEPATADEVEIVEVWREGEDLDPVIEALEDAGCNIYETLQERILESRCWEEEG